MKDTRTPGLPLFGVFLALGGVALAIYTWQLSRGSYANSSDVVFRATMSAVITGVGIVMVILGRLDGRTAQTARTLAARHPDEPWLWRDDWEQGLVRPETNSQAKTWMAAGVLLLLLSAPIALRLRAELVDRNNYLALIGLAFPAVGLLMVGRSFVSWLRDRKFGDMRLALSSVPAVLGGRLAGRIDGVSNLPAGAQVNLVLSCVRSYVSGSGTDRPRWQRVLWQDKRTAMTFLGGPGTASILVEFEIPYDATPTDSRNPDDEVLWRLAASAALNGLDFHYEFQAPVFKTESSDARLTVAVLDAQSQARHAGIKPSDSEIASGPAPSGGARFHLAAARHKGIAAAMTVFGLLCVGSGAFFGYGFSQFSWVVGLIPVVILGGLGLLLLAIAFGLWFGSTTVEVVNRELRVRKTYLVFSNSRSLRKEEIQGFELHNGMQRGDEVWYDLRARLANGRRRTICGGMEKNEADWFLGEVKRDMGI